MELPEFFAQGLINTPHAYWSAGGFNFLQGSANYCRCEGSLFGPCCGLLGGALFAAYLLVLI
jgi:hypothetical protein